MKLVCFSLVLFCLQRYLVASSANSTSSNADRVCDTLYLLNVVPYPDNSVFAGWDRGFELIPAGHLATRHINNDPNVLPGYKLEVLDVASEACGRTLIVDGFLNYYRQSLDRCVYGVVGLYCSTVTNAIAPFANHPEIGYVQMAASTSPLHRDTGAFPYTFHTISSSRIFNEAMVKLMDEFNWRRVNIVFDSLGFYFRSTADDFAELIRSDPQKTLTATTPIQPLQDSIVSVFNTINNEGARIGYFSVSEGEIASFFCDAYKRQFLWPGYVYVLQERSLKQIHLTEVSCTQEEISKALEGTFLLQYRLFGLEETKLISGLTYEQYHDQYITELEEFERETNMNLDDNAYANTLYDQVWAFALAANLSLDTIDFVNTSVSRSSVENSIRVRDVLAENLNRVEFDGASGFIKFGSQREIPTSVEIYQVQNGTQVLVGEYDAFNKSIHFFGGFDRDAVPGDTFEVRHRLVPMWLGILTVVLDIGLLLLIFCNTTFIMIWKDRPEIKSSSYVLSLIIMLGCCILCLSPVFKSILAIFVIEDSSVFTVMCNLQLWSFLTGNFLIFVTLLVRLLRVFHIFRSYHSTGKYWSDKYLVLYIFSIWSIIIVLLVIWTAVNTYSYTEDRRYISTGHPPFYLVYRHCSSGDSVGVWLAVAFSLIVMVMVLLVFLAIQTRHIKHQHFKDTKKVNIFIFSICTLYTVFLPLWLILSAVDYIIWAFACLVIANLVGPMLCQVVLFLPKTIPAIVNRKKKKVTLKSSTGKYRTKYSTRNSDTDVTLLATVM